MLWLPSIVKEHSEVPIYCDIPDDFDFTDMSVLPRMKTDPAQGTRILVAFTTCFY